MKQPKHYASSMFFFRLLGYFFLFFAFCGIVLTVFYLVSRKDIHAQYLDRIDNNFSSVSQSVDDQLLTVQNLGANFFLDGDVIMYFKSEGTKRPEEKSEQWRIHRLIQQNETLLTSTVRDIFAFIPTDIFVLTSAGHYDTPYFFNTIDCYDDYDTAYWLQNFNHGGLRLILPETRLTTRGGAVEVIPVVSTARLDSRIAVHVSNIKVSSIEKLLIDNSLSGRTAFAFVRDDGKLIYSSDRQLFSPEHLGIFQKMESKTPYGEYFLFKEVSESSGWTYLALVNKKDINGALNDSVPIVIALGLLLVLGGIGLALLFSFQIYLPINQAAEKLPSCEKKNRRPDELKLLSEGIDQLLLNEDAHRKEYLTYSLLLLINGLQGDDLNQVTEMTRLCLGFSFSRYLCAVLLFDNQGQYFDTNFLNEQDLSIDKFFHFSIPCIPLSLHGGLYACIFNLDSTAESRAAVVRKLSQSQELYVSKNICLYMGIGNSCDTLKKLSISYNQALAALKTCNRDQRFDLVEFSQLPVKNQVAFTFYDQKAIVNNIQSGNASALSRYLEELFIRNEKRGISKENQLELYHQVFLVGQRCLDDQNLNFEEIEGYQGIRQFFAQGEGDGRKLLLDFFLNVQRSVYVPSQGGAEFKLADEARRYLEQNFQKPLSLDMIADDLGISAKYLSRVFKAGTGENISFALSRIRMEKAKLLLSDDNVRIGEVALAVGMDSRATFLRVFKKIVGVNPSEYKAIALQEENDNLEEKI